MKPAWFLEVSPLGKTPVLLVDHEAIFESGVICEYLEETLPPSLHPASPLARARHRGWIEFGSAMLGLIAAFYNAPDDTVLTARARDIGDKFRQVEAALGTGRYFDGESFSLVDAAFAAPPSITHAVDGDYQEVLRDFLYRRGTALSQRMSS